MKERKSFRFSLDTFQKLDTLQELEKQQAEKFNITPKSITAIVEDAIAEYYVLKLDKDTGMTSYTDESGNKRQINSSDVAQLVEDN